MVRKGIDLLQQNDVAKHIAFESLYGLQLARAHAHSAKPASGFVITINAPTRFVAAGSNRPLSQSQAKELCAQVRHALLEMDRGEAKLVCGCNIGQRVIDENRAAHVQTPTAN